MEIVGFKDLYGLEIFEVNANTGKLSGSLPLNERQNSLETPCGASATRENKKKGLRGQEERRRRQVLGRSAKNIKSLG